MHIRHIRYFLVLAESLNFTKAAEQCDIAQPTLSRAVKSLEEEFGGELLRRERGRTHLTELGRLVLPKLKNIIDTAESAKAEAQDFAGISSAVLRLGVMCTIGPSELIPIITRLAKSIPQLEIDLLEAPGPRIVEDLAAGELDVALVGLPHYPDTLALQSLYMERYVVAFPPGHRFEKMAAVPVAELDGEPYLERLNCEYILNFNAQNGPYSCEPITRYRSEHEDWIQAMILAGMGCACLPEFMIILPDLMRRPLVDPEVSRTISLATVRGRKHSPAIHAFSRICMDVFRHRPRS